MRTWSLAIVAAALALSACGMDEPGSDDTAALQAALVEREAAHYDLVVSSPAAGEAHAECAAYAEEMADRMAAMRETCRRRMGDNAFDRLSGTAGTMADCIERHRARCLAEGDVAALRDECAAHHREMGGLLDQLGGELRAAGMMGERGACGR